MTQTNTDELLVGDYLSLARNMLWVVNHLTGKKREIAGQLTVMLELIDHIRDCEPEFVAQSPEGKAGLPPNPALVKLAKIILLQKDKRMIRIGSSAFTSPLIQRSSKADPR